MLSLSAFGMEKFYEIDYRFGQNDLLKFAYYAKKHNKTITTYRFSHKYSLIYYGGKPVEYGKEYGIPELKKALEKEDNLVIIPYEYKDAEVDKLDFKVLYEGRKYILVEKK